MPVKKILVPVRGDGKGENVLAHAAAIARHHHAHVEVLHCRARPADMIPYGVVVPSALREQIKRQAKELADAEEEEKRMGPNSGLHIIIFDEIDAQTFGRGYGEENDFSQRAIAAGWTNLIAADVLVRHIGAA